MMLRGEWFQSAPAITGGRSRRDPLLGQAGAGFNPRPPSLAGDPFVFRVVRKAKGGFNPRPPSLAGDPIRRLSGQGVVPCFNPRPPSLAGDPASRPT